MTEETKKTTESTETEREVVTDAEGNVVSDSGAKKLHETVENKSRSIDANDGGAGRDKPA